MKIKSNHRPVTAWSWELWRSGRMVDRRGVFPNATMVEGMNALMDIGFKNGTIIYPWYIALFSDNYTPLTGDTYAVPGYTEFTGYSETGRQAFNPGAIVLGEMDNSANQATFNLTAAATLYGGSLVNIETKGDIADVDGILYSGAKFTGGSVSGISGDILKITVGMTHEDNP